jgi:predicted ATP-dependent endonuclease of OLD family
MQIARLVIDNFRSIEHLEVSFSELTSLVGSNNAGKSTILKALDFFFEGSPKITSADYFMHDTGARYRYISISII